MSKSSGSAPKTTEPRLKSGLIRPRELFEITRYQIWRSRVIRFCGTACGYLFPLRYVYVWYHPDGFLRTLLYIADVLQNIVDHQRNNKRFGFGKRLTGSLLPEKLTSNIRNFVRWRAKRKYQKIFPMYNLAIQAAVLSINLILYKLMQTQRYAIERCTFSEYKYNSNSLQWIIIPLCR